MEQFHRISRLPPYVFNIVTELKVEARARGEDIIDFGMGNPDLPTPPHIVEKLCEAARNPRNHRYSASRGITKLRSAIADWYGRRYGVEIDPGREAIATIGAKEGLSHLALAVVEPGDVALVPSPTYPIHPYSVIIAGGDVRSVRLEEGVDFYEALVAAHRESWPPPKLLILSFPHNPTTATVDLAFFEKVVAFAQEHHLILIHDLAYADLTFDGYQAPSLLQVPGAKEIGVEFFTLSKSYNMPGWRVGFCVGNPRIIAALTRLKSYLDYGMFQPIQIAAIIALNGPQACVGETVQTYRVRRDALVDGLNRIGWTISKPKGTMFVWAKIPEAYLGMGSLEFSKFLLDKAKVAVSPGIGFGQYGDAHVRFALVENEHRTRQAIQGLKRVL
ncbi:MAG: alanine transaminase [Candidatus Methylomirabilis oxygeniifera]|uniref:Putative PLP-dependent aminotransferase, putative aspartate aminotransferase n=1 Tax=Methylomirabilis oxygeniifera TaxID=671143 RepID=D5MFN2_METO1|nr:MAG: alanine transaminase [Candidatus Methylomirabilis oxyfera]CBE68563.1 putative PLP-dependent aminotransferase, putative aspartate aminotransferase [Candidatus Methylomirabilis oxyfera]